MMAWLSRIPATHTFILAAIALLGFAHIAFLPPFEGFDETAHLSYIQQIADTGTFPKLERDMLSGDVTDYAGPLPAATGRSVSYRDFFADGARAVTQTGEHRYRPGPSGNWQAQHPPLYYVLLTPFYKMAQGAHWNTLFLVLRSVSWTMAFAGFAIGALATLRVLAHHGAPPSAALVVLGWPVQFPQFFPEMARLGNDSLCLLLIGIAWALMLRLMERRDTATFVWLGLALGVGLWTKAFFVPITASIGAYLLFVSYTTRDRRLAVGAAVAMATAFVTGGGWYIHGVLSTGSTAFLQADNSADFWDRIGQVFDLGAFLQDLLKIAFSFVWSGTWSFASFGPLYTVPILALALVLAVNWLRQMRLTQPIFIAPLFIVVPFVASLAIHTLTQMTKTMHGNDTPGWYLHILAAPAALALARGWRARWPFITLALYAVGFHVACWALQLAVFSGCVSRSPDDNKLHTSGCLIAPENLAVIAWPTLGAVAIMLALGAAFGAYRARENRESTA